MQEVRALQFGCGVGTIDGGAALFTSSSPERIDVLDPGSDSVRMQMDPNYLCNGDYTLTAKLFADGQGQETIERIMTLNIRPRVSANRPAYFQKWVAGHLRFDYEWEPIKGVATADPGSAALP